MTRTFLISYPFPPVQFSDSHDAIAIVLLVLEVMEAVAPSEGLFTE